MTVKADIEVRDVYRRHYRNYIMGRRINALTLEGEAWFWRVHDTADDFGNNHGNSLMLYAATAGRRVDQVTPEQVKGWVADMAHPEHPLIGFYEVEGVQYLHVFGYTRRQPAGKNGKRVHRFPQSPWDDEQLDFHKAFNDAGGILGNPDESCASHSHSHSHSHSQEEGGRPQAVATPAAPPLMLFPVVGKKDGPDWPLSQEVVDEIVAAYPNVDVLAQCRKALAKIRTGACSKKTAKGMTRFLMNWMSGAVRMGETIKQPPPKKMTDDQQREQKKRESAELAERQDAEEEHRRRVEFVKSLSPEECERLRQEVVKNAPNDFMRRRMLDADPCGGGRMTDLIYSAKKAGEFATMTGGNQ